MIQINIDERWFTDPRRYALAERVESIELADGVAIQAWRLARDFWKTGRRLIPKVAFLALRGGSDLLAVDLAIERNGLIYVRGTKEYHEWLAKRLEAASKGGRSAKRLKSLENEGKQNASKLEANAKQTESKREAFPFGFGFSFSNQKQSFCANPDQNDSANTEQPQSAIAESVLVDEQESYKPDLEAIFKAYPKRLGATSKSTGMKRLAKLVRSPDDFDAIMAGVNAYRIECANRGILGTEFVKQFGSFFGPSGPWKEYALGQVEIRQQPTTSMPAIEY